MRHVLSRMRFIKNIPLIKKIAHYCLSKLELLFYGKIVIKEIDGIRYKLDLSEMIDSSLYFYGHWERNTSRILREYIKPNMTVFEVGANIGAHTFSIAKKLDPNRGKLFSFEPTEYAFNKLQNNFNLNNFKNIVLEKIALSDINEEKDIHRATSPETSPFKASWDKKKHGPKNRSIDKIKFQRLDDYFIQNDLKELSFMKIDVDGYELRVIKGGKETINKYKPIILIELGVTVERMGDNLEVLVETISSFGYSIYSIESSGIEKFDKKELLIETVKQKRTMDCLCLPT